MFLNEKQLEAVRTTEGSYTSWCWKRENIGFNNSRWLFSKCKTSSSTKYFITYIYTKAEEIRSRVAKLPGMNHATSSYVVAGTFHSVFLKLLRSQGYNQQILANENINKL